MPKPDSDWIDIRRRYFYLDLSGKTFSPAMAEKKTRCALVAKLEPGAACDFLPQSHPNHGKPSKMGQAVLESPERVPEGREQAWIVSAVRKYARAFRRLGATEVVFWEVHFIRHGAQENFEMSVTDMRTLAEARVPYCLSVYHCGKRELASMSERLHREEWQSKVKEGQHAEGTLQLSSPRFTGNDGQAE